MIPALDPDPKSDCELFGKALIWIQTQQNAGLKYLQMFYDYSPISQSGVRFSFFRQFQIRIQIH